MVVVAVLMIGAGVFLMYEAWHSHKTGAQPTPIKTAVTAVTSGTVLPSGPGQPAGPTQPGGLA